MAECYNADGNLDPTQYVNATGVCVHAGGRRRRSTRRSTRRQNVAMRRNSRQNASRRQNMAMRRNTRQNATRRRRNNGTGMRRRR